MAYERHQRLIAAVEKRPSLYDQTYRSSRNVETRDSKNEEWMEIAKEVYGHADKFTAELAKNRWKSLRDAFVRHQRRPQATKATSKPYAYEKQLKFLLPHVLVKERRRRGSPAVLGVQIEDIGDAAGEAEPVAESVKLEFTVEEEEPSQSERLEANGGVHPVDAFFGSVAQTVKRLKPETVARVKEAVANIVMDAEIDDLEKDCDS